MNPNYTDKYLQIHFTVDDAGAFTTPWTATVIYQRDRGEWPEIACAENPRGLPSRQGCRSPDGAEAGFLIGQGVFGCSRFHTPSSPGSSRPPR